MQRIAIFPSIFICVFVATNLFVMPKTSAETSHKKEIDELELELDNMANTIETKPTASAPSQTPKQTPARVPASAVTTEPTTENLQQLEIIGVKNAKEGHCAKTIEALLPQSDRITLPAFQILTRCLDIHKKYSDLYRILKSRSPTFKDNGKLLAAYAQATIEKSKRTDDPFEQNKLNTEAIQIYRQAISAEPSPIIYEALLKVFQDNNSKYEARELLHEMIDKFGEKAAYMSFLCQREALDGYLVQARESCQKAIDKNPKDEKSKLALIQVMLDQKEEDNAIKLLEATTTQFPNNESVQFFAAQFYFKKNNYVVTKRFLQKAISIDPNKAPSHLLLGKVQVKLKEDQEALTHFLKACKLDPKTQSDFQLVSSEVRQRGSSWAEKFSTFSSSCSATKSPASL